MNKEELQQYCVRELAEYEYSVSEDALGKPWSTEKVEAQLKECASAIVEPYQELIVLRDTVEQMKAKPPILCEAWVVADDKKKGYIVFYDPNTEEFGLASYVLGAESSMAWSIGVNGDFVGTFMAR